MPLRALFLDVGFTLLREVPSRYAIYAEVARAHGRAVEEADMRAAMRAAHEALPERVNGHYRYTDAWFVRFIERIFGAGLDLAPSAVAEVTEELFARFEDARTFRLYPGCEELLATARERGLRVGVVSNWSARLPRLLDALGLSERLDVVVASALEGREKPDPELFRRALERAAVDAAEAVHAGDRLDNDVRGARRAGLHAILVDHSRAHTDEEAARAGGDRVRDLAALGRWILDRSA